MKKLCFFLLMVINISITYAAHPFMTCPPPAHLYKIFNPNGSFTGLFGAQGGWGSKPVQDYQTLYKAVPGNFTSKTHFVRVVLFKTEVDCEYSVNNTTLLLSKKGKFKPYDGQWRSNGRATSDPSFEIMSCGEVSICKFNFR